MRKAYVYIIFIVFIGCFFAYSVQPHNKLDLSNPIDRFFYENPEYLPDTIIAYTDLPKVNFYNNIIDSIVSKDLYKRLNPLKKNGKILLSLRKTSYEGDSLYYFNLITPSEPTSLEISDDSIKGFIGYIKYKNIVVLISESFLPQIKKFVYPYRNFTLKLVKQRTDIRWERDYLLNGSSIKCFGNDLYDENPVWKEMLSNYLKHMDEHSY